MCYVNENFDWKMETLAAQRMTERHTADYIENQIRDFLKKTGLYGKVSEVHLFKEVMHPNLMTV